MTKLLERAFSEAARLPESDQDTLAQWILRELRSHELSSERRWDDLFAKSANTLERLVDEALAEFHAGRTELLNPDKL